MTSFRPWGHIDWLLPRTGGDRWSLIGCVGTEERSTAIATHIGRKMLDCAEMLIIRDPDPLDRQETETRLQHRSQKLLEAGFRESELSGALLLSNIEEIRRPAERLASRNCRRVIIDITSMPKRWFFPLVQGLLLDSSFTDIIATYCSAGEYAEQLSESVAPLRVLPGFFAEDGRTQHGSIIVGIGFEPISLMPLLSDHTSDKIRLIFPFPPGPPGHRKNWMFVKQIEELTEGESLDPPDRVHIHMYDCPQIFDALCKMTDAGKLSSALAPYGPKTVSLAMCLFSIAATKAGLARVPAYYAQPQRYAIDYTTGVGLRGSSPDVTGYCLRLGGRDLYCL